MNNIDEKEKYFVNTFIEKSKRERLLHELSNDKKRIVAMSRFNHVGFKYLDNRKLIYQGNKISRNELFALVQEHTGDKQCYIMAYNREYDQKILDSKAALDTIIGNGMAAIMIWSNLVIIESEQEQGPAEKYVLLEK